MEQRAKGIGYRPDPREAFIEAQWVLLPTCNYPASMTLYCQHCQSGFDAGCGCPRTKSGRLGSMDDT